MMTINTDNYDRNIGKLIDDPTDIYKKDISYEDLHMMIIWFIHLRHLEYQELMIS